MAKPTKSTSTFTFNADVHIHDPSKDLEAIHDDFGQIIRPASRGRKVIPAGEPVALPDDEGQRILSIVGPFKARPVEDPTRRVLR